MTLEAWVNPTQMSGWETILMKERGVTGEGLLAYALYAHDGAAGTSGAGARPASYLRVNPVASTTDRRVAREHGVLPLNTWTHIATTYDGANIRFYVNGVARRHHGGQRRDQRRQRCAAHRRQQLAVNEFFRGLIDEVRVYNRALSAAENRGRHEPADHPALTVVNIVAAPVPVRGSGPALLFIAEDRHETHADHCHLRLGDRVEPALAQYSRPAAPATTTPITPDSAFVAAAAQSGFYGLAMGRLAATRASSAEVKRFAEEMSETAGRMSDELKPLLKAQRVAAPAALDQRQKAAHDWLQKLSGPDFDRAFVSNMRATRASDVMVFTRASDKAHDADVRAWAARLLPILKDQQERVNMLK